VGLDQEEVCGVLLDVSIVGRLRIDLPSVSPTPPPMPCKTSSAAQVISEQLEFDFGEVKGHLLRDPNLTKFPCRCSVTSELLEQVPRVLVVRQKQRYLQINQTRELGDRWIG
jgi:hypothetical protein